jgi:predicted RNase H-like HicB family nuclease
MPEVRQDEGDLSDEVTVTREEDGRWIAEVERLPGVLAYGATRDEAVQKALALAAEVDAEKTQ